jgi:hypothetical protein
MKFKDTIIIILLAGLLVYAACRRNNIIKPGFDKGRREVGVHANFDWKDSIRNNTLDIVVDSEKGLIIKTSTGEMISANQELKTEAISLNDHQIFQGDTITLLHCKITASDSIQSFRLTGDGKLLKIKI